MGDLRVGVIGCGGHAQSHFSMIKNEPRMELVAVAEVDSDRLQKAQVDHQPQFIFTDFRQMLDQVDLDLVYVVTMPGHLLPIVLECLGRDLHTSIEKSPGMNPKEARQMLDVAQQSKGLAIVSLNRRYKPEVLAVRKLLQERGGAIQVSANYHKPPSGLRRPGLREVAPPEIICDAIHHVDLLRWMSGRTPTEAAQATEVYAHSWHGDREGTPRYNAIMTFDNGCRGTMVSHYGVGYRVQTAEVHAENMSAYLDLTALPEVTLYLDGKKCEVSLDLDAVGGAGFNETRHFADCILNDTTPWSSLEDLVYTMDLCQAIESGHQGQLC